MHSDDPPIPEYLFHKLCRGRSMTRQFKFDILADWQQFYIQDEVGNAGLLEWKEEDCDRLLTIAPGVLGIGTVREGIVPVILEVSEDRPHDDLNQWDQVNECSLELISGQLVIPSALFGDDLLVDVRIYLTPATYRARLYYGNLAWVSGIGVGEDRYKAVLWRAAPAPMLVLKKASVRLIRWASFVSDSIVIRRRII